MEQEASAGLGAERGEANGPEEEPDPETNQDTLRRIWRKNTRLVYISNFVHMTMYTMCLGGIFDIYLYELSQGQQTLSSGTIMIGEGNEPPVAHVDTYSTFELTFSIRPSADASGYPAGSQCIENFTCGTSLMHITDGSGNGDCCRVGNRIPLLLLGNRSTQMYLAMDDIGQDATGDRRKYDELQLCRSRDLLPTNTWSEVKVKASGPDRSKGKYSDKSGDGGALVLFVNGRKECEVQGAKYHELPQIAHAQLFFGTLQAPYKDPHVAAHAEIRDVKYGRPASNLFVGLVNSIQGIVSVLLMYPIGWLSDKKMSRYNLVRINMFVGVLAALLMTRAVSAKYESQTLIYLFSGIIVFTLYQQCYSSLIYAILADNVSRRQRTQAGVNYKTFSALAQSFGPAVQLLVILAGMTQNSWTAGSFDLMLLPGWLLMPVVAMAVFGISSVGKKVSRLPTVDEAPVEAGSLLEAHGLNQAWLDTRVVFKMRRRFVVAGAANVFFIATLLANGMTTRYFALYFTQILKFSPAGLCVLNAACRLWIAGFAQLGAPLAERFGRANVVLVLHVGSALFTLGIYGGGFASPSVFVACASYLMRFACLHTRDPLLYSITMDVVPQSQRSRWAALNSLRTLSFSASAVLGGYIADMDGYDASFNITVIALLVGTVFFIPAWVWFPRKEGIEGDEPLWATGGARSLTRVDSPTTSRA